MVQASLQQTKRHTDTYDSSSTQYMHMNRFRTTIGMINAY